MSRSIFSNLASSLKPPNSCIRKSAPIVITSFVPRPTSTPISISGRRRLLIVKVNGMGDAVMIRSIIEQLMRRRPEIEKTGLVRHASRMFVVGASLTVPLFTIVLRKGYGLGAQAMAGGSFKAPLFTVAWPTGEFGGMGLEGAVRLGFRRELDAIEDEQERQAAFDRMVARAYEHGKALNVATYFEIDD